MWLSRGGKSEPYGERFRHRFLSRGLSGSVCQLRIDRRRIESFVSHFQH